jgi:hypothetical protein
MGKNQRKFYFNVSAELEANLRKLQGNDMIITGRKAVAVAGHKVFKVEAKKKARVYNGPLVGYYKYGYKGKLRKPGTLQKYIIFKMNKDKQMMQGLFSAKDPVAHLVEYGHRTRKGLFRKGLLKGLKQEGKGTGKGFTTAFPFMRPAIKENSEEALRRMGIEISKFLSSLKA